MTHIACDHRLAWHRVHILHAHTLVRLRKVVGGDKAECSCAIIDMVLLGTASQ